MFDDDRNKTSGLALRRPPGVRVKKQTIPVVARLVAWSITTITKKACERVAVATCVFTVQCRSVSECWTCNALVCSGDALGVV
jgi:hypothetical protein